MTVKSNCDELVLFGGKPLFDLPRSTSSLVQPDFERFLKYSQTFYEAHQFTNNGPLVQLLEQRLAAFHQASHCVTFCSGFWALVLAIKCLALPKHREIIMPSLTYRRMADVAAWAGLVPRFCEVDAQTLALSADTVRPHLTEQTALILGVHPIMNCCDAAGLEALADESGVPLLMDAVESVYETYAGRKVGSFARAECFSLHASKLLNGFEGGYVTTNDAELAARLVCMRGFGFYTPDNVQELGMNAKLNEVHAAMALAGLDALDVQVARNHERYLAYRRELTGLPGVRLVEFDESERSGFKNILVELLDDWPLPRSLTLSLLNAERILARAYYSPALHQKPTGYPTIGDSLPVTERLAERFMLLPCGHFVDEQDIHDIVAMLSFLYAHADELRQRSSV